VPYIEIWFELPAPLIAALNRPNLEVVAGTLLRTWLVKKHKDMLVAVLTGQITWQAVLDMRDAREALRLAQAGDHVAQLIATMQRERLATADALDGVTSIVDAATGPSPDEREATEFFATATRNLQEAGQRAGVRRIVVVSIIGIDKLTAGYNVAKLVHEHATLAGPIPARVLRAAQFHEFVGQLMDWGRRNGSIRTAGSPAGGG